jgi:acyl-CoA reductase-like NAD-dependent aldehyde dehydrogenase
MRSDAEKRAAVWRVVEAARTVAANRGALVPALVTTTGLSAQGVELAFARHLETDPREEDVAALVASAGAAKHVVVILSANVFVAALRAIAIACAASPSVVVRPSRREPHFARALVEAAAMDGLTLAEEVDLGRLFGGEVHVYGRDATIAEVRARVDERMRVRGHGAGMGVAVVSAAADLDGSAAALARDVVAFDQRGCLSPRVALVEGAERAARFGEALDAALRAAEERVPRGELHEDERAEARRYASTMAFAGRVLASEKHAVGIAAPGSPLVVPPPGRHVHVAPVATLEEVAAAMRELAPVLVAVGADDVERTRRLAPSHARVSALGEMQRPPLDGPVDRR